MSSNTQLLVLVQNYSQEPVACEKTVKCADFGTISSVIERRFSIILAQTALKGCHIQPHFLP